MGVCEKRDLRELQGQKEEATDIEIKRVIQYMIQISVEALKLKFQEIEVPGFSKFVLLDRKKRPSR